MDKKPNSEAVAEYLEGRKKYEELRKQKLKKGSNREEQVKELNTWSSFTKLEKQTVSAD